MNCQSLAFAMVSVFSVAAIANGQLAETIKKKNVEEADSMAVDLVELRTALPDRWVALQRRSVIDTAQLDNLNIAGRWVEEFIAHAPNLDITRYAMSSKKFFAGEEVDGIPMTVLTYRENGLTHYKHVDEDWRVVPAIPNFGYKSSDPFSWCLGLQASERGGTMDDGYLARLFWVKKRQCLFARESQRGLVSYWGSPDKNAPPFVNSVEFDKKTRLPRSYAVLSFTDGVSEKATEERRFNVLERGEVQWKEYAYAKGKETIKIMLPIHTHTLSVQFKNAELECNNEIYWILGDDVPNKVFEDPRKSGIVECKFPEVEEREKLRLEERKRKPTK